MLHPFDIPHRQHLTHAEHYQREARKIRRVSADVLCAFLLTAVAAALATVAGLNGGAL